MDCNEPLVISSIKADNYVDDLKAARCISILCQDKTKGFLRKNRAEVLKTIRLEQPEEILDTIYTSSVVIFFQKVRDEKFILGDNSSICTYLVAIAKNVTNEIHREFQSKKHHEWGQRNDLIVPEESGPIEWQRALLRKCIESLNPEDKQILISFHYGGLDLKEYAQWRNIPHSTARKRFNRAMIRLKQCIENNQI